MKELPKNRDPLIVIGQSTSCAYIVSHFYFCPSSEFILLIASVEKAVRLSLIIIPRIKVQCVANGCRFGCAVVM